MRKKIDNTGRLVLPKSIREKAKISGGEDLEVSYNNDTKTILIERITEKCSVCGNEENLQCINDIILCQSCVDKIKQS